MKTQLTITVVLEETKRAFIKVIEMEKATHGDVLKLNELKYTISDSFTTINHNTDAQTQTAQTYQMSMKDADELDDVTSFFLASGWSTIS